MSHIVLQTLSVVDAFHGKKVENACTQGFTSAGNVHHAIVSSPKLFGYTAVKLRLWNVAF
jgi:hypothetical protein